MKEVEYLNYEEVLEIHDHLVSDFAQSNDPISPPGVRDGGALLHSAVLRQTVGLGPALKYSTPELNAATLCYGICNNHCFHNGNKRTALVALLCHLDKNGLTFSEGVTHDQLYDLMLRIASHDLLRHRDKRKLRHWDTDAEVQELAEWIRKRTRSINNGERVVTYRELRQILKKYGFEFSDPKGNFIDIVKFVEVEYGIFIKKTRVEKRRVCHIPYPRDGAVVGRALLRRVREDCGLVEENGYDSNIFYNARTEVDVFINQYRKTLRRLAKV